ADRRDHLRLRVEADAVGLRVPLADGQPQLPDAAARRVAVVRALEGGLAQLLDGEVRRGDVGVAEAEVDHVSAFPPQLSLQLVDGREDVGRQGVDATKLHFGKYCRGSR